MSGQTVKRLAILAVLVIGIIVAVNYREQFSPEKLEVFILGLGFWGPLVFIGLWIIAATLFIPGSAITLAGGALFGPLWGTVYTVIGSVTGATIAFLIARYTAADWVERKSSGLLERIKTGVEKEGWLFVAFTRLVPLFPFNLLNYVFGLTRIPLRTYVITSAVCMAPGTAGYSYLGFTAKEAAVGADDLVQKLVIAIAVIAVLVLLPILFRKWYSRSHPKAE